MFFKFWLATYLIFMLVKSSTESYKTTEYLHMEGVLDSIEIRMLRRADYMKERNILRQSHIHSYETQSVRVNGWELGGQIVCSP